MDGTKLRRVVLRDVLRVLVLVVLGDVLVFLSTPFSQWVGEPAFAAWGLFTGGAFYIAGFTHILRRTLFNQLDLQLIAGKAADEPTGAGLVFFGVCTVISAFVLMLGGMIRS